MVENQNNPIVSNSNVLLNPDAHETLGAATALLVVSAIAIGLRFWGRWYQRCGYQMDDWFCLPALAANITMAALTFWGYDSHSIGFVTPKPPLGTDPMLYENSIIQNGKKVIWGLQFSQTIGLTFTKLSCLLLYRRVFYTGHKGAFHWASMILITLSAAWGVAFFISFLLDCNGHIPLFWTNIRILNDKCPIMLYLEMSYGITDFAIDIWIWILPFIMISRLTMSSARKIATIAIFILGAFAIGAGIVRMISVIKAITTLVQAYEKNQTGADDGPTSAHLFWMCIESGTSILAACLPCIYVPCKRVIKRLGRGKRQRNSRRFNNTQLDNNHNDPNRTRVRSRGRFWFIDTLSGIDDPIDPSLTHVASRLPRDQPSTSAHGEMSITSGATAMISSQTEDRESTQARMATGNMLHLGEPAEIDTHVDSGLPRSHESDESIGPRQIRVARSIEQTVTTTRRTA